MPKKDSISCHNLISAGLTSRTMIRWSFLLTACLSAAGCAVGQSEYSCSGIPDGVQCHNARDVLDASKHSDGRVTNADFGDKKGEEIKSDKKEEAGKSSTGQKDKEGEARASATHVPDEENGALPLRTPSRVMRVWYAPWETAEGDLHVAKIVYTEVEARRWTIGKNASVNVVRDISPLEPVPPARNTSAAAPKAASSSPNAAQERLPAEIVPPGAKTAAQNGGFH